MNDPFLNDPVSYDSLMLSCSDEDYDAVVRLIDGGSDVNMVTKFGKTPLIWAVRNAYVNKENALKITTFLLDNGSTIDAQTSSGETALMQAVFYGYTDIFHLLLERGANMNLRQSNGQTILSITETTPAMKRCRRRMAKELQARGAIR